MNINKKSGVSNEIEGRKLARIVRKICSLISGPWPRKPIFLVGCARSGTTLLSSFISFHPDVGPKPFDLKGSTLKQFTARLLEYDSHMVFSESLEKRVAWFRFFDQKEIVTNLGRELICERCPTSPLRRALLLRELTKGFKESRLFLKGPTNSFRIHAIRELFPDALWIALHRNGCDVINSWGAREYGFKQRGFENGISFFAEKWNDTVDYLLAASERIKLLHIRYEDLIKDPEATCTSVWAHCDLRHPDYDIANVKLANRNGQWYDKIPQKWHKKLTHLTARNNKRLGYT